MLGRCSQLGKGEAAAILSAILQPVNSGVTLTVDDGTGTDLTVNGTASVNGTGIIGGAGSFTLSSGATLGIGSTAGITSSGATGTSG